jgi:integration host factor subunit alpha
VPLFAKALSVDTCFCNRDLKVKVQGLWAFLLEGSQMTLTKRDIVNSVMQEVRLKDRRKGPQKFLFPEMDCISLSRRRAEEIVESLFEIIKKTLANGEDIVIAGFGKFQVKFKWARKGRNPQTGEMIILRSRRTVTFRTSPKLRKKMNTQDEYQNKTFRS